MKKRLYYKKLGGSFTVEASLIVPIIVAIVVISIHLAMEQETFVVTMAQRQPLVEELDVIGAMYNWQ